MVKHLITSLRYSVGLARPTADSPGRPGVRVAETEANQGHTGGVLGSWQVVTKRAEGNLQSAELTPEMSQPGHAYANVIIV